ncbi:YfbM family protein [Duganella sp. S19_KUP01_CR8]|uniref:YfbM family protein n=1 Tax=Duganella sp. S19_KUP01_CR8 TaxID=3025502 RepID=UPI002FCD8241
MGMAGYFVAVNAEQIAEFKDDPDSLADFLYPAEEEPKNSIDVDKAWHAIHYMLNGAAGPEEGQLAPAIFGGEPVGEEMDYGPARILSPEDTRAVAATLATIDEAAMRARYAPEAMAEAQIYPDTWLGDDEALDYVIHYYLRMAQFYADAAKRGDGVVLFLA